MPDPKCETDDESGGGGGSRSRRGRLPADDSPARPTDEVSIEYEREAPRGNPDRRIHERMPAPSVPEGEDVPDRTPSPPVDL